jgi:putative methyltransferase (TIGR04325 family)
MRRVLSSGVPQFFVHYEAVDEWPQGNGSSWSVPAVAARFKHGAETFDFAAASQSPSAAFASPIVRENLALLDRINLAEATLLDFGCGNGLYCLLLQHHPATKSWKYVGVDINEDILAWCRATHAGSRFELLEGKGAVPFGNGAFDVVMASGVLQYIEDHETVLAELRRVTSAYLLISRLPMWKHLPAQNVLQHVRTNWGLEHHPVRVFNRDEFEALLMRSGFSVVHRDYGSEFFQIEGVPEPAVHNSYLLQKSARNE